MTQPVTTTHVTPPAAPITLQPPFPDSDIPGRSNCNLVPQVIVLTAINTIPLVNIFWLYNFVAQTWRHIKWSRQYPENSRANYEQQQLAGTYAMRAVATFMIAVGSAFLLVGLYYHVCPDYTLSNDLFMIGGIATAAGFLLFSAAAYVEGSIHGRYKRKNKT